MGRSLQAIAFVIEVIVGVWLGYHFYLLIVDYIP